MILQVGIDNLSFDGSLGFDMHVIIVSSGGLDNTVRINLGTLSDTETQQSLYKKIRDAAISAANDLLIANSLPADTSTSGRVVFTGQSIMLSAYQTVSTDEFDTGGFFDIAD